MATHWSESKKASVRLGIISFPFVFLSELFNENRQLRSYVGVAGACGKQSMLRSCAAWNVHISSATRPLLRLMTGGVYAP